MGRARRRGASRTVAAALIASALALSGLASTPRARAADASRPIYLNPHAPLEARVADLLARLTPAEKISLMAGGSAFATQPIPRLGIPALHFSDGPNGVRSNSGVPATVFPTGSALAATWNPRLIEEVGRAIGREARAMGVAVMLGPNVNIEREPLAGRNFESYSEDPFLAGTIGAAMVRGIQSEGVGTSVKHFVGNEQELERMRSSSDIDERTLREIYLLPFEMIVKEAHPWTVMASYNRLNGTYMSENRRLLHDVLEGEWGFDGVVMSDWGAVHSTVAAASSGLDLEMPGPANYFGARLESAVEDWQVSDAAIEDAARRMVRLIIRCGALDGRPAPRGELRSARNRAAALAAAREAITLLKNDGGLLPLDRAHIRTLAVIGPNADVPLYEGGGSAHVIAATGETPLTSLRRLAGPAVRVLYAKGADNDAVPPPADARLLTPTAARAGRGLAFRFFANATFGGPPVRSGVAQDFNQTLLAAELGRMSGRWDGDLWPPIDGEYEFSLSQIGTARLYLDGREIIGPDVGTTLPAQFDFGANVHLAKLRLTAGSRHTIRIDYVSGPGTFHYLHLGLRVPPGTIADAVRAARAADAAIVFVGSSRSSETEGRDRADMALAGRQDELVEAVLAANPHTIVVLQNGAPYALPWAAGVPAIVEGFLAGEEGPDALAQILFGEVDPSGKLPFTFPVRLRDNPAYLYYGGGRDANYGEGVFVGYRYYDKRGIAPLFPFGHGLSYTTFRYANLRVPASVALGQPLEVSIDVTNSGRRAGEETVELYVGDAATMEVVRPIKELKGFAKVRLTPGETRTVSFTLTPRDLSYYDVHRGGWTSTPGTHRILIGSSSRDIRAQQDFALAQAADDAAAGAPDPPR
ncbi:MAG TPA: glycoside hydrolase family 3 C-terminal domain-containing protein [Steroidobacteraceae bacterium]|nr:glycoside hydrolase family 3 C-terminal domain-containing protein [Steroidobacteraceae bacterium]